jgi:hypothetical protein
MYIKGRSRLISGVYQGQEPIISGVYQGQEPIDQWCISRAGADDQCFSLHQAQQADNQLLPSSDSPKISPQIDAAVRARLNRCLGSCIGKCRTAWLAISA